MNTRSPREPQILMQIAGALNGRNVIETCIIDSDGVNNHLWGLQEGHTLVLYQRGGRFTCFEERAEPIAFVVNTMKYQPNNRADRHGRRK